MQLKSLELVGFKSFPDRTLISFSDGITAIIGPNGSGKSNIADAVRWVMGETSAKTLRGAKTEDVIFDGTQARKPLGFAEVTLTLLNSDGSLDVPYDEVAITRRYYRSGDSEYFINKKSVRLRDIQQLLRDTGLGKTGYSIIGQGSVTEIITAKSTERRHFFEEAAGIAGFKFKKEESERKLKLTAENLVRLTDILNELSERMGPLERQAEKAKKYLTLYEEKKKLEIAVWLTAIEQMQLDIEKAETSCVDLQQSLAAADEEVRKCEEKAELLAEKVRGITADVETLREQIRTFEDESKNREAEILLLRRDTEHAQADIQRIENEINGDNSEEEEIRREIEQKSKDLSEAEAKTEALTRKIFDTEAERETSQNQSAETEKQTQSLVARSETLTTEITSLQIRLSGADERKEALGRKIREAEVELSEAKSRLEKLEKSRDGAEKDIADTESKQNSLKNMANGCLLKFNGKQERCEKLRAELNEAILKLRGLQDKRRMLEEMEKHYEGFSGSVKGVMAEAEKGVLKGVCGTVASLIKTPSEYSVAIEIALGAAIQNVVTESEKDAKACIAFLKSRNLGRATFLPVDTIKGKTLDVRAFASAQGFVGVANEIIKYDDKYAGVISSLLGRTVITETLNDATEIARRNGYSFKIVSLDGQVVNAGGSLTGGSVGRSSGILSRGNEIENLAKTIEKAEAENAEKDRILKAAVSEMNTLSAQIEGINAEMKTAEDAKVKRIAELDYCKLYISNVTEQISVLEKSIADTTGEISSEGEDREKTISVIDEKSAELEALREKLREAADSGAKLRRHLDEIRDRIYAEEVERVESVKTAESLREAIKNLEQRIAFGAENVAKKKEEIANLLAQNEANEMKIKALDELGVDVKRKKDELNAQIDENISKRGMLEAEKNKSFDDEKRLFEQKEKLAREAERMQIRVTTLHSDSDGLIAKIWDEYEMTLSQARDGGFELSMPHDEAKKRVSELRTSIKNLGSVNVGAIEEYSQVRARHDELKVQTDDLTKSRDELLVIINGLVVEMKNIFEKQFKTINSEFSRVFKELFNGGSAHLELTESDNILEAGIEIYVAPPGKIIKNLSSLSGGEQSLTAIALYFALLFIRPSPFCLLDEIESALDDVNVVRYAQYLNNLSQKTQFLLITHRRGTMEIADRLYGVTMREKGVSKMLTINVKDLADENL